MNVGQHHYRLSTRFTVCEEKTASAGSWVWTRPQRCEQCADGCGTGAVNPLSLDFPLHHHPSIPAAPLTAGITIQQLR